MKQVLKLSLFFLLTGFFTIGAYAQTTITGAVIDAEYNEGLFGATVVVDGTTNGTVTDATGEFSLKVASQTSVDLKISFVGYETQTITVNANRNNVDVGEIMMNSTALNIMEINVIADRAKERETPVAFSNVNATQIENQLGSMDLPMIMNITPGVYATMQGGGAGDARINVRGFDQRNVAIMINGVPVNDMENGWVYWSNWDGIADATSSIQLQRGLSAVNLATPSIGGTMNILTSPANHQAGGSVKFEYGSGNFMKTTVAAHTGLINDKFAMSVSGVRKTGNGVIDGTWTDAWAYYIGATYNATDKHRFEAFVMGAPQRHGQNLYKQNIAAYSHEYAQELGLPQGALDDFQEAEAGRLYNENASPVDPSYEGQQWWNGKAHDRYSEDFINERENFFHKPLANLNWYARWGEKVNQYTTVYYSGGKGGGTGTYGSVNWDYSGPSRVVDYNSTIAENAAADTAFGILRNSRNNQWTIGAISRLKIRFSENLKGQVGVDWRTATIFHFREVRDLLGGDFFVYDGNDKELGDKIAYDFTNTVDWFGYFAQLEYTNDMLTAYGTFGNSFIKYTYTNHFVEDPTNPGAELYAESDRISGYQAKGGVSYRPMDNLSIFANYGYISKVPIFDNVINDRDGLVSEDPTNETFNAFEFGATYTPNRSTELKINFYNTSWEDRSNLRRVTDQAGNDAFVFLTGMDQKHMGVELEGQIKPHRLFAIGGYASIANWNYSDDVIGSFRDYDDTGVETDVEYTYYVKDLKVGDAPQMQFGVNAFLYPVEDAFVQFNLRYNGKHFAAWDPFSRQEEDRAQVWETPAYFLLDLHAGYTIKTASKYEVAITGHVFNLLDEIYIQDAVDNSPYNGYYGENDEYSHTAAAAEVFLGLPMTFNIGVKFSF
jgi:iron complex outermembrane receptor protein